MKLDTNSAIIHFSSHPDYTVTPLRQIGGVWVKDERSRLNQGSFKALGGAYAVERLVQEHGQEIVVCCATAGNHGLSVATGAQNTGTRAVIFLDRNVPTDFEHRLQSLGAEVIRSGANYELSMAAAASQAQEKGWYLVSDSSWPGYTTVPQIIMEGYTIIAQEMKEQFQALRCWPDELYLQAGVGGFAAALAWSVTEQWPQRPRIIIVEPESAACLQESHRLGKPTALQPDPQSVSVMGRLDCKEPSLLAFEILEKIADEFMVVSDREAESAAEELARLGCPTTPSGAAGFAGSKKSGRPGSLVVVTEQALSSRAPA